MKVNIEQHVEEIMQMVDANDYKVFEPYIRYIRFPQYKHLKKDERIDFGFPITVLVGPNGCNKSSILQALFGCPQNKSVGTYWFSTDVDQISKDSRHCFIYGYKNLTRNCMVEVLKTRIQKPDNPDYWEPARPQIEYGMQAMPKMTGNAEEGRSQTRWNAINKIVLYLDFRQNLPAFDKYFYHTPLKKTQKIKTKQDHIRRFSKHLQSVIVSRSQKYEYYNKSKVHVNKILTDEKCRIVSRILGKDYSGIQIIEHSFYGDQFAKTVVISDNKLKYSEAFAGSGETSIIILVDEIMDANEHSLILLDEPETSLHPAAQKNLIEFIAEQVKRHKHQVVMSTHSPFILYHLPSCAIKALCETEAGIQVLPDCLPEEAFSVIGSLESSGKIIFVEDKLAKEVIESYVQRFHPHLVDSLSIHVAIGGADTIITKYVYPYSHDDRVFFLLDGDKEYKGRPAKKDNIRIKLQNYKNQDGNIDIDKIPMTDNTFLHDIIIEVTGSDVSIYTDGTDGVSNKSQLYEQQRFFLKYWFDHVVFLYGTTPEEAIIMSLNKEYKSELCLNNEYKDGSGKQVFLDYTKKDLAKQKVDSDEIFMTEKRYIAKLDKDSPLFYSVDQALKQFFPSTNSY